MCVEVDEASGDDEPRRVDAFDAGSDPGGARPDLGNAAILDHHVGDFVAAGGGVDDTAAGDREWCWLVRHSVVCTRGLTPARARLLGTYTGPR